MSELNFHPIIPENNWISVQIFYLKSQTNNQSKDNFILKIEPNKLENLNQAHSFLKNVYTI